MFNNKFLLFIVISALISSSSTFAFKADDLRLIQVLKDNVNGVDGLGNPRNVKVLSDNSKLFVSSGDDNALAVFNLDNDFKLSFSQIFKNSSDDINGLEGASGVTYIERNSLIVVSGFYDGAVALFSQKNNSYHFSEVIRDEKNTSKENVDFFGLLGAWEVINTNNEKQLLVASYMSNAISIFDITQYYGIIFNRAIRSASPYKSDLGKPVSLALSPLNDELYVLGFESNQLTIFERADDGELSVKQVLVNGNNGVDKFVNPQKIVVSHDGKFLYVACSGSHSVVVFQKTNTGQYVFVQAINNSDIDGSDTDNSGLKGAGSLAISSDGSTLYAAGEAGVGLYIFNVEGDGRLSFENKILRARENELRKISSITLTDDNRHLLVATGKDNSLYVFKVKSS